MLSYSSERDGARHVGLVFMALHDKMRRLRVNGTAAARCDDPLIATIVGAQLIVRLTAQSIFPNSPRHIPSMQLVEPSIYAPRRAASRFEPGWKVLRISRLRASAAADGARGGG